MRGVFVAELKIKYIIYVCEGLFNPRAAVETQVLRKKALVRAFLLYAFFL